MCFVDRNDAFISNLSVRIDQIKNRSHLSSCLPIIGSVFDFAIDKTPPGQTKVIELRGELGPGFNICSNTENTELATIKLCDERPLVFKEIFVATSAGIPKIDQHEFAPVI